MAIHRADHWYDKGIRLSLYTLAVLVPVTFSPWFSTVFSAPKLAVLRLLTLLMIGLWACKIFVEKKFEYRRSRLNVALVAYAVLCVATTVFSDSVMTSIFGAENRFIGLITMLNLLLLPFFVFNFVQKKEQLLTFMTVAFAAAAAVAGYALLQWLGITNGLFGASFVWSQDPQDRVFSTIGQANHLGAYLGMTSMLGLALLRHVKKIWVKIFMILAFALQFFIIILTGSRGAFFAFISAGALMFLLGILWRRKQIEKKIEHSKKKWMLLLAGMMVITAILAGQFFQITLFDRTASTVRFVEQGNIPDRVSWWLSTLQMIKDRPLLGFGLSSFRDEYNQYRRTDYRVPGPPDDMQDFITPEAAHNEYLNIAATQGLVGIIVYLILIGGFIWGAGKALKHKGNAAGQMLIMAPLGAVFVYLLQTFVSFGVVTTLTLFFISLGIVWSASQENAKERSFELDKVALMIAVLVGILVAVGGSFTVNEVRGEWYLKQANIAEVKQDLQGAIENYQYAVLLRPYEYAYYQAFGDFALKNSTGENLSKEMTGKMLLLAVSNYEKAVAINNHHPSLTYNLGIACLQLYKLTGGNPWYQKGSADLQKAIELSVNNPLYAYQTAMAYLGVNAPDAKQKAKEALLKSQEIRPGYRDVEQQLKTL